MKKEEEKAKRLINILLPVSIIFSFLLATLIGDNKLFQWDYPSYTDHTSEVLYLKETVEIHKFCSFVYEGKEYGASDCHLKENDIVHVKTCGNKDSWCYLSLKDHEVISVSNSPCNVISQDYDEVSGLFYLLMLLSEDIKKPVKIPSCITGS